MRTWLTILTALIVILPGSAAAQRRGDVAFRGGISLPTQDLGNAQLGTGAGFEATVGYHFLEHLSAYAGWGWRHFGTDVDRASFAGIGVDVEETGYVLGLRFEHPLAGAGSPALVLRGGATITHIEVENTNGDLVTDSGHGLGWEAGAGVSLPLGTRWRIVPLVSYRALARDLVIGSITTPAKLRYVGLDVGFHWSF